MRRAAWFRIRSTISRPRVGFAYNLFKNTVMRGGYGVFYSSYEAGPLSIPNPGNNPPFFEQANYNPSVSSQIRSSAIFRKDFPRMH